jgi:methylated-DNA-[protein]-cysteine S-methyltransferase
VLLTTIPTPAGPFVIAASEDHVYASGWSVDPGEVVARIHPSLRPPSVADCVERRDLGPITEAVAAYVGGDVTAVDDVPVVQRGGPFLEHAWKVLRTVGAGHPITYSEFAAQCGYPSAVRAAATACARNAPALFVPCHRVLRRDGSLGGFRWGLDVKRWLLDHERPPSP